MCKVFLSSLKPVTMRWFDGQGAGSIDSFKEHTGHLDLVLLRVVGFLSP